MHRFSFHAARGVAGVLSMGVARATTPPPEHGPVSKGARPLGNRLRTSPVPRNSFPPTVSERLGALIPAAGAAVTAAAERLARDHAVDDDWPGVVALPAAVVADR